MSHSAPKKWNWFLCLCLTSLQGSLNSWTLNIETFLILLVRVLMSHALNIIIHQIRLVSSIHEDTAIPNTLLHDNSNCRCVTTIVEFLMVLTFWGVSSFPGHIGMRPSVTGSELLSLTHWLSKHISGIHTASTHLFGYHFISYSLTIKTSCALYSPFTQAKSGSHVCLIVSLSWMTRWFPWNKIAIIGGKHYIFGHSIKVCLVNHLINHSFQLITGQNVNACLIVTFSWLFYKPITFKQLSLTKK